MTGKIRRITNGQRSRILEFQEDGNDIHFTFSADGEVLLKFNYSSLNPFSGSLPWNLCCGKPDFLKTRVINRHAVKIEASQGFCKISDKFSFRGEYLHLKRRWVFTGRPDMSHVSFGTGLLSGQGGKQKVTIPHVIYNGNPSASEKTLVPRLRDTDGYSLVVEEHRLPIPAVNVEWEDKKSFVSLTLFSMPSRINLSGKDGEHWWSSGVVRSGNNWNIVNLSGVVAMNNIPDKVYDNNRCPVSLPGGGYLDLRRGGIFEKNLFIDVSRCEEGRGFRRMIEMGWNILRPKTKEAFSLEKTVMLKKNAMLSRWREGEVNGFLLVPETEKEGNVYNRPPSFLFGWTGQSLRLAWCAISLGIKEKKGILTDIGCKVMDAFADAPSPGREKALKCLRYWLAEKQWEPFRLNGRLTPSRAFGEAVCNLCDSILLLRGHFLPAKDTWLKTVEESARFLSREESLNGKKIFPLFFTDEGKPSDEFAAAGGASCITALLSAYEVTGKDDFLKKGLTLLERYYYLFADRLETPFSHATLDAMCEDKEAGLLFFSAAYKAFLITGMPVYGNYAKLAADWASTFVYLWEPGFRKESICHRQGFRATFWPGVSVQNMHLDVFFYPFEVYNLGRMLGEKRLVKLGRGMMKAWTHGISRFPGDWGYPVAGEQAEQFFHTNFSFGLKTPSEMWRGGYNPWNTTWIMASVLQSALRFLDEKRKLPTQGDIS